MASLYLLPELTDQDVVAGSLVTLGGDEGRHAIAVARVRVGERLSIGDGRGTVVAGSVSATSGTALELTVESVSRHPRVTPEVWLAQALAKGDRDELAVQAATELGVSGVIPWAAERSVSRWDGPKAAKGRERWASIVREATKQSIRPYVPPVAELTTTAGLATLPGQVLVLVPEAPARLTEVELDPERVTLVVGPEGGTAPRELETLAAGGATLVRLGAEVLRTSTAGPAALAVLNARLGRW
ncbi:16S rRNA (uracil(1498)-N(3))-methyltransferase [Pseudolysinimonas sp.]